MRDFERRELKDGEKADAKGFGGRERDKRSGSKDGPCAL